MTDGDQTHRGDDFIMYINIEYHVVPETNIIL